MFEDDLNIVIEKSKEKQMIIEMADIMSSDQQYGFLVTVYSDDHNPPHAHVRKLTGETIGQFLITDNPPKDIKDIQLYRTESLDRDIKKDIVEWANKNDPDFGCIYWTTLKNFWKRFQASNMNKK